MSAPHTIVTGGASGIGAATVEKLRGRGHAVTIFDLTPSADPDSEAVDVTDEDAVSAAFDRAAARRGPVTGLAMSHGIRGAYVPALEMDIARIARLYEIHVIGALVVARQMVRRLDGRPGSVVLVSSTTAYGGWANQTDYGTAKAAERQLMANLAIEWAPLGVRVNAIAPGHTRTPMVQDLIDKEGYDVSDVERRAPLGRLAEPAEQAEAIAWLLSDATFVTGQCLPVDGGWTAAGK
ncbi:SDR family NAD(P)-dependent oxidoreductase [Microbacterium luticocti]|uniref:SDR family NAD(P)-dependent oxidoreductase n=1 Tax=Microbacterium luticocti TaxID=451764 RepID=UPI0003F4DEC7|nr:SDR family oxidoreductase [Microbacterium luticocti]